MDYSCECLTPLPQFFTTLFLLKALQLAVTNVIYLWVSKSSNIYLPKPNQFVFLSISIKFNMYVVPALFLSCTLALLKWTTTGGYKASALWLQSLTCILSTSTNWMPIADIGGPFRYIGISFTRCC